MRMKIKWDDKNRYEGNSLTVLVVDKHTSCHLEEIRLTPLQNWETKTILRRPEKNR